MNCFNSRLDIGKENNGQLFTKEIKTSGLKYRGKIKIENIKKYYVQEFMDKI